ncbi:MAG TPA: MBL fold metallo-hydrolase [Novosphingobium sp.]
MNLEYPDIATPESASGSLTELADGLFWATMPVNEALGAINIWLLRDAGGWSVIDTGWRNPQTLAAWQVIADRWFAAPATLRVFCTHMHPDHCGVSGWLAERYGASLHMTRLEYYTLRMLAWDVMRPAPAHALAFYRATGIGQDAIDNYRHQFGEFGQMVYPLPDAFQALADGDRLRIGGRTWDVIVGRGHSPEHACFYCAELKVLVSGDQILPRISSNVSVYPYEPEAEPLSGWVESLGRIKTLVPADVLVLPAHGRPFRGLHERIDALIDDVSERLRSISSALGERPCRVVDIFPVQYNRPITAKLGTMAAGETLAHLAHLCRLGRARRVTDAEGVHWWRAVADTGRVWYDL